MRFVIKGLKEVEKKLAAYPKESKKVIRRALRAALGPLKAAVKAAAPVDSGLTQQSVKLRAGSKKNGVAIKIQISEGDYKGVTFYNSFVEFGFHTGGMLHPGVWHEGSHWEETVFKANADSTRQNIEDLVTKGLDEMVKGL